MKAIQISTFLLTIFTGSFLGVTPTAEADTPAFVLGEVLDTQPESFTGTRGWEFGHGGPNSSMEDILVTQLGVFDPGGDGLVNSHEIGLWQRVDNLTGTLLASATVPSGTDAPLEGGYRWVSIDPVRIPYASGIFVVAAQYSAGDADDLVTPRPSGTLGDFQFAPDLSVLTGAGRFNVGDDLPYPFGFSSCGEGCTPEVFWEPNLQYRVVPEPSAGLLLIPGLVLLFRKLKKTR